MGKDGLALAGPGQVGVFSLAEDLEDVVWIILIARVPWSDMARCLSDENYASTGGWSNRNEFELKQKCRGACLSGRHVWHGGHPKPKSQKCLITRAGV